MADARQVGLADGVAGAFRHDRLEVGRLRGRHDQDLAADGEAEPADPVVVHVGARLEVLGAGDQVAVARPADRVAFARALTARVQEQDAVAVPDQHPGLGGAGRAGEEDHRGAVLGGDVRAVSSTESLVVTVTRSYGTRRSGWTTPRPVCVYV